jgi:segregation and condensation protein A
MKQNDYSVNTPLFEGPLDLLLSLIERAELDITKLSLARVTDQYVEHIKRLQELNAEDISSFLVIAAKLIQIKSQVLLPKPPEIEISEEDAVNDLVAQLVLYKKFKETGKFLAKREREGLRSYRRVAPLPQVAPRFEGGNYSISDIISAAAVFSRQNDMLPVDTVVAKIKITIKDKIKLISRVLRRESEVTFQSILVDGRSRIDVVVTFLAMLELVKRHLIVAKQEDLFGEINIVSESVWDGDIGFEVEFD